MGVFYIENKVKRFLLNILVSILSIVFIFMIFEILFRICEIKSQKNVNRAIHAYEDYWNQYDPILGWKHIPNKIVQHAYQDIPVIINKQGFRAEKEYDLKRKKILAIGCSFTFGHGVSGKDAWPQKLEDRLRSNGFDYDVINMGACAYGLDQTYLWFLEKQNEFKPDIVILGLASTLDRLVMYRWFTGHGRPRYRIIMNKLVLTNVPVPHRILPGDKYQDWESIFFDSNESYFVDFVMKRLAFKIPLNNKPPERLQLAEAILKAFVERCKENDSGFLVALLSPDENIKGFLIKNKIDFTDCFESLDGKKSVYINNDGHPSSYGHELIAENVYQFLLKHRENYLHSIN